MACPFPGMDPFLEHPAFWPDFHSTFINYWREALADHLPDDYEASIGERIYLVEQPPPEKKRISPDVSLSKGGSSPAFSSRENVATIEPVIIPVVVLDPTRESYIEILHQPDRTLVAVLELLSPANKENPGRAHYLVRRDALLVQQIHLIELDLLLGGTRLPFRKPLPPGDYYYLLARADQRPNYQVYAWNLRQPLPTLPVPLLPPDGDIHFDLGKVFATTYDRGRYRRRMDYRPPPPAKMSEEDQSWIAEKLSQP